MWKMEQEETFAGVLEGVRKNEKNFRSLESEMGMWEGPREEWITSIMNFNYLSQQWTVT